MALSVTDPWSHSHDHMKPVAEALRRSARLKLVFMAIYKGKSRPKTVSKLMNETGLKRVAVLQEGARLAGMNVVNQIKIDGETAYEKTRFWISKKNAVLNLVANPKKLKELPTKYTPKVSVSPGQIRVAIQGAKIQTSTVTCDDFDQFTKTKKISGAPARKISEAAFKRGIQALIGETGEFRDWGGERNDLYTSKLRHKGQRRPLAFAFKGPGTKGVLTPKKLGKNGDQIQRLFSTSAEIFIVQYHDQIDHSVIEQMAGWAKLKSIFEGKRIWYGVIDGDDTNRLLSAYPKQFGLK